MNKIHKINKKTPPIATLNSKNLLSIEGMNKLEINSLLDRADYFAVLDPLKIINFLYPKINSNSAKKNIIPVSYTHLRAHET